MAVFALMLKDSSYIMSARSSNAVINMTDAPFSLSPRTFATVVIRSLISSSDSIVPLFVIAGSTITILSSLYPHDMYSIISSSDDNVIISSPPAFILASNALVIFDVFKPADTAILIFLPPMKKLQLYLILVFI